MGLLRLISWWSWAAIAATVWAFASSGSDRAVIALLPVAMVVLTRRPIEGEEKRPRFPLLSFVLAGFAVLIAGADYHPVTWLPVLLPGAAAACAGFAVLYWKRVSLWGRNWIIPATGLAVSGVGGVSLLNGALDRAPAQRYQATVSGKFTTRSSTSRSYGVRVSGLAGGSAEIYLDKGRWNSTRPGDRIPFEYHPGALGYPWIVWR